MPRFLPEIIAAHRRAAEVDARDLDALKEEAHASPAPRSFAGALHGGGDTGRSGLTGLSVVAEVKRRSPSRGEIAPDLDPADVAAAYAQGGAAALSVLTDEAFFGGSPADLRAAKGACGLPTLRKDFTVCEADVCDARLMGADAVLLIVAALSDRELAALDDLATSLGLDALVEVHDDAELDRALDIGARLVGVNQRDLATFDVDPELALRLAPRIPQDVVAVAESGIRGTDDARKMAAAGFDAILVGEAAVTSPDRAAAVRQLSGHPIGGRAASAHAER